MAAIIAVGTGVTVAIAAGTDLRAVAESSELRVGLQTAQALIAAFAAYLLYGRFRRSYLVGDLLLVYALGLLAATSIFLAVLPSGDSGASPAFRTWAALALRVLATGAVAAAAIAPPATVRRLWRPGLVVFLAMDATLAAVAVAVAALVELLPPGVDVIETVSGAPDLAAHGVVVAGNVVMAILGVVAARGFLARLRDGDPLISALAVGSLLAAFAYVCFAIYPSADTEIVQGGDALAVGFYLVLLFGAEREIATYWSKLAQVAVMEERRRLARDLHDGVAQELAYIVTQTRMLLKGTSPPGADARVAAAAERALDESRRAISALTRTEDEPLHLAIARAAEDVAGRLDVEVRVDASSKIAVAPPVGEALVRIVRESITNAARHGHARCVTVSFTEDGVLSVVDDGTGFEVERVTSDRFGIISMRERAEGLGARFKIESAPGRGTRVEVALR